MVFQKNSFCLSVLMWGFFLGGGGRAKKIWLFTITIFPGSFKHFHGSQRDDELYTCNTNLFSAEVHTCILNEIDTKRFQLIY